MRGTAGVGAALAAVMVTSMAVPAGAAPSDANASPPSAQLLVEATNAMLRPSDVPAALASTTPEDDARYPFTTGYANSFAGGDPIAVCSSPKSGLQVFPPTERTIVYQASATGGELVQDVYAYPTDAAAAASWATLGTQIRSQCNGSASVDGVKESASSVAIPGVGGVDGLAVFSSIGHQFSAVHLLGSSIQMVSMTSAGATTNKATRAAAVNSLATTLAGRWVARASLPLTQDPSITRAARSMQQPADLPSATPVMPPARGGQDSFTASLTGSRPLTCEANSTGAPGKIPASSESFRSMLGVDWDSPAFPLPGAMDQSMYSYGSPAAAQRAWAQLGRSLATCRKNAGAQIPANKPFERMVTGVLPFGVSGIPGLWARGLTISDSGYSRSTYTTYLLIDTTIQGVTYTRSLKGMKQVPLDQGAVNVLSASLAQRWAQTP